MTEELYPIIANFSGAWVGFRDPEVAWTQKAQAEEDMGREVDLLHARPRHMWELHEHGAREVRSRWELREWISFHFHKTLRWEEEEGYIPPKPTTLGDTAERLLIEAVEATWNRVAPAHLRIEGGWIGDPNDSVDPFEVYGVARLVEELLAEPYNLNDLLAREGQRAAELIGTDGDFSESYVYRDPEGQQSITLLVPLQGPIRFEVYPHWLDLSASRAWEAVLFTRGREAETSPRAHTNMEVKA